MAIILTGELNTGHHIITGGFSLLCLHCHLLVVTGIFHMFKSKGKIKWGTPFPKRGLLHFCMIVRMLSRDTQPLILFNSCFFELWVLPTLLFSPHVPANVQHDRPGQSIMFLILDQLSLLALCILRRMTRENWKSLWCVLLRNLFFIPFISKATCVPIRDFHTFFIFKKRQLFAL